MNRREFVAAAVGGLAVFARIAPAAGQARTITPDLGGLAERNGFTLVNRTASRLVDGARTGVRVSAANGEGVALLPGSAFGNGAIELDIRGKDVPQQSFVGVAFHAVDGSALDAVYFRPFNFKAADPLSRSHAVQYHAEPGFSWDKLRADQPGTYEQPVNPVPDPNAWFHARIVVADPAIRVFVSDATTPCLAVNALSVRKTGLVGLWVGNGSGGDFANLTITPAA